MPKITVQDADITIISIHEHDYISLTDMAKSERLVKLNQIAIQQMSILEREKTEHKILNNR